MSEWHAAADPSSGATYYFNPVTSETVWELPEGATVVQDSTGGSAATEAAAGADAAAATTADAAAAAATPAAAGADDEELKNWAESTDPASGNPYYFNSVTQVTSWEAPPGWEAYKAKQAAASAPAKPKAKKKKKPKRGSTKKKRESLASRKKNRTRRTSMAVKAPKPKGEMTIDEKLAERAKRYITMRKFAKNASRPQSFRKRTTTSSRARATSRASTAGSADAGAAAEEKEEEAAVVSDWMEATHPDTGQVYYYNAAGETRWEKPE